MLSENEEAVYNSYLNVSRNNYTRLTNFSGVIINIAVQMSSFTWEVQFSKISPNQLDWAGYSTRILKDLQDSLHFK